MRDHSDGVEDRVSGGKVTEVELHYSICAEGDERDLSVFVVNVELCCGVLDELDDVCGVEV